MQDVTLYQFALCPFCHKVKAALELKGIPYKTIEVNPMTKKELPELPSNERAKVPVLKVGEKFIADSTEILKFLETEDDSLTLEEPAQSKSMMVEEWVDDDLAQILPAVIYGKAKDAIRAAQVVAKTSNFGLVQNAVVRFGGSLIMNRVAQKILARRGGGDAGLLLEAEMDKFEDWLGEQAFVGGEKLSVGDAAVHGCLTCIEDFPAFSKIMERQKVSAWYERVSSQRKRLEA